MDEKVISRNIKTLRTQQKVTLEALAKRTGLTKGYLSKIERSEKAPPYSTLAKIAGALGLEVVSMLSENTGQPENVRLYLSRKKNRQIFRESKAFPGYDYEVLAENKPGKNMEPFIIHAPWGINKMYSHEGEEFMYVLNGTCKFIYGEESFVLEQGDTVYFDACVPHSGKSIGEKKADLLVIIYFYKRNRQ